MGKTLDTYLGKVHLLDANPRKISAGVFNKLTESLERDPEFLMARGIVVWQVPTSYRAPEGAKSPFTGQIGKLVVLGGNMRCLAFQALGYKEVKREWIIEAKDERGNWWPPEKAERFILVDNNPEGLAGENDYEKMIREFEERVLRESGIDFSNFQALLDNGTLEKQLTGVDEEGKDISDQVEEGEVGEKNAELQDFINEREKTRRDLKYINETGFHLLLVFPEGFEQKAEFIAKSGAFGGKVVSSDASIYLDLVFESYDQKMAFAEAAGLNEEDAETGVPPLMYGMFCDGRAFAKRMGISLKETGLHFRDRIVDNQLAEMANPPMVEKTEGEVEEEIFQRLRAERRELGMDAGVSSSRKRRGGKRVDEGDMNDNANDNGED